MVTNRLRVVLPTRRKWPQMMDQGEGEGKGAGVSYSCLLTLCLALIGFLSGYRNVSPALFSKRRAGSGEGKGKSKMGHI